MTKDDKGTIEQTVRAIVAAVVGVSPDHLRGSDRFGQEIKGDSLVVVEVVLKVEQSFGIIIPNDEYARLDSIAALAGYVQKMRVLNA